MKSIKFPDMFNRTTTNIVSDYDATLQNLKMLLWSEKNSLFGDPYFGTGLKNYIFEQNDYLLKDLVIDKIYTTIAEFMPQIWIQRSDIDLIMNGSSIYVTLKATNRLNYKTDLYNIVLFNANV